MAHGEARAWWADVQHLRNDYERTDEARRRADEADAVSPPSRRTVEIRGRTVPAPPVPRAVDIERSMDLPARRHARMPVERIPARPDRMALWALLMGVVLILVAVTTADAATLSAAAGR